MKLPLNWLLLFHRVLCCSLHIRFYMTRKVSGNMQLVSFLDAFYEDLQINLVPTVCVTKIHTNTYYTYNSIQGITLQIVLWEPFYDFVGMKVKSARFKISIVVIKMYFHHQHWLLLMQVKCLKYFICQFIISTIICLAALWQKNF